jgi:uncharacterized protein (DUF1697 family)
MAVYVALIRAIGPVTHAKMGMGPLRDACAAAGLEDVATVGNTGNVLCRSKQSPAAVRRLLQMVVGSFDLDNEVFLNTPRRMAAVVAANPFPEAAAERPSELGVCTFHKAPDWTPLTDDHDGPEGLAMIGAHLVVEYPAGISGSRLHIEKRLGATMTMRNWRVFAALAEKSAALARQ